MVTDGWHAVIIAAGDKDESLGTSSHRWMATLGGIPLLARVCATLQKTGVAMPILLATDDETVVRKALARDMRYVRVVDGAANGAASALAAVNVAGGYPLLITRADAALLTPRMVKAFMAQADASDADFAAGLVASHTVAGAWPDTRLKSISLGSDRFHFAKLYAVMNPKGLKLLDHWSLVDRSRQSHLRIAGSFGWRSWVAHLLGFTNCVRACRRASRALGIKIVPIMLPYAEAALDLSEPGALALGEALLARRSRA